MAVNAAYFILLFIKAFICNPVAAYWDKSIPGYQCMDMSAIFIAIDIINIISDLTILLLPAGITWSLKFPLAKKIRISVLLSTGGLACGLTVLHLYVLALACCGVSKGS